ncbi:MAG: tail fiber protein [Chthoniobacter sp.]|nr:tail fiber protein [Chthoniobacter sp.]
MAEPFLAEIRIMSFGFPPKGWATCDGQLLPINQNQALFSLLGTTYGGDGRVNFGLPNLDGRVPMHMGNGHVLGERGGEQGHTLNISELPTHTHVAQASSDNGTTAIPAAGTVLGSVSNMYGSPTNLTSLLPATVTNNGGSQAHLNMQPFLVLNFSIALQGIFPSQT